MTGAEQKRLISEEFRALPRQHQGKPPLQFFKIFTENIFGVAIFCNLSKISRNFGRIFDRLSEFL
jgi:hypothetical protein